MTSDALSFRRLLSPSDSVWHEWLKLYEDAFPLAERREREELMRFLAERPEMHAISLEENGAFTGLCVYWNFETFVYLEHFAIIPERRCCGVGGLVLEELYRRYPVFHILEVEPSDTSETALRRIGGYRRHGYEIISRQYLQPPYRKGDLPLPLWLMGRGNPENLGECVAMMHSRVFVRSGLAHAEG